jgi:chemotaxis response regulator CheB
MMISLIEPAPGGSGRSMGGDLVLPVRGARPFTARQRNAARQRVRVVHVDDDRAIRIVAAALIEANSSLELVASGHDGAEAIALDERFAPDVLLMEIDMNPLDGCAATRMLRTAGQRLPVILVSGDLDRSSRATARWLQPACSRRLSSRRSSARSLRFSPRERRATSLAETGFDAAGRGAIRHQLATIASRS